MEVGGTRIQSYSDILYSCPLCSYRFISELSQASSSGQVSCCEANRENDVVMPHFKKPFYSNLQNQNQTYISTTLNKLLNELND